MLAGAQGEASGGGEPMGSGGWPPGPARGAPPPTALSGSLPEAAPADSATSVVAIGFRPGSWPGGIDWGLGRPSTLPWRRVDDAAAVLVGGAGPEVAFVRGRVAGNRESGAGLVP